MEMVGEHGRAGRHAVERTAGARNSGLGQTCEARDKKGRSFVHKLFTAIIHVLRRHKRERIVAKFCAQTFSARRKIFVKIA